MLAQFLQQTSNDLAFKEPGLVPGLGTPASQTRRQEGVRRHSVSPAHRGVVTIAPLQRSSGCRERPGRFS